MAVRRTRALRMYDPPHQDRRRHVRQDIELPGAAHVLCDTQVEAIEVWTKNLSPEGVCLMSQVELRGERMLLDIPHPEFQGRLIECEVRHRSSFDRELITGEVETLHVCGVKFRRVIAKDDLHESLRTAFLNSATSEERERADAGDAEESLMPFLSALGILVVYASRLPWM